MRKKIPPSLRDLVMVVPRPLRKYVRYQLLPRSIGNTLGKVIDGSRDELFVSRSKRLVRGSQLSGKALYLHSRLFGGFSERALAELESLKRNPLTTRGQVAQAARILSSWQLARGDIASAYNNALLARHADLRAMRRAAHLNLEVDCLAMLGEREVARHLLEGALALDPTNASLRLALANTFTSPDESTGEADDAIRISEIRKVFKDHELLPVELKDAGRHLSIDNLSVSGAACHLEVSAQPKVSVFVCAYRASNTLHIAIDSLLSQTWSNLEIIIVDDRSPDDTFSLAKAYESKDPRVRAIQQATNSGPYAGRNLALAMATGEFVTVHDADDWSHPQKIEIQVRDLLESPNSPGNMTDWVRCFPHLYFRAFTGGSRTRVGLNHSSLLLRTQLLREMGGWDPVRFGADTELIRRVVSHHGVLSRPYRGVPLSFALDHPESLTRHSVTHASTRFHGVRRVYHEACSHWRVLNQSSTNWKVVHPDGTRAFPAPRPMLAQHPEPFECDLLFVMDWASKESALRSMLSHLRAAIQCGFRVAVFHHSRFENDPSKPPSFELLQLAQEGKVYRISPGEKLAADTVVVGCPALFVDELDLPPVVQCGRLVLLVETFAERRDPLDPLSFDPTLVDQAAAKAFGRSPMWVPTSPLAREHLSQRANQFDVHDQTWSPVINAESLHSSPRIWRGQLRPRPVVGRHGRNRPKDWPSAATDIAAAFCANRECEVRLLGEASVPLALLGGTPSNWRVLEAEEASLREFLEGLDFWIHHPREAHRREFEYTVFEALAAGAVVILPRELQAVFGDAAVYSDPETVYETVRQIWANENRWTQQVEAGLRFVRENCSQTDWATRIESMGTSPTR